MERTKHNDFTPKLKEKIKEGGGMESPKCTSSVFSLQKAKDRRIL
jgi:hypothetical protein